MWVASERAMLVFVALTQSAFHGCSRSDASHGTCGDFEQTTLDMNSKTELGLSGADLKALTLGDYEIVARRPDGVLFPLSLKVTSDAEDVEQKVYKLELDPCRSSVALEAHFEVDSQAGQLRGQWDGIVFADRASMTSIDVKFGARASIARSAFELLPTMATAQSFSFGTTLGTQELAGGIVEVADAATGNGPHPTESTATLAQWGPAP